MIRPSVQPRPIRGVTLVAASALLFGINGTVSKLILEAGIDAPSVTLLRAAGAFVGLTGIAVAVPPGVPRLRAARAELPLLIAYGLCGFFLVPMLYFVAIDRLPVGIALLFEYMAPLLVALWARFGRRQRVRGRLWAGLALSIAGLACVAEVWHGSLRLSGVGVAAGLGAAVLLCVYYLLGARGAADRDAISLTWWAFGAAAAAGLLIAAVRHGAHLFPVHVLGHTTHGLPVWALAIYLVVGGSIAPFMLVATALRHLPPTSVGIIGMLEPVVASVVAWMVLDERLSPAQIAGGVLILVGVGIAETARIAGPAEAATDGTPSRGLVPAGVRKRAEWDA